MKMNMKRTIEVNEDMEICAMAMDEEQRREEV